MKDWPIKLLDIILKNLKSVIIIAGLLGFGGYQTVSSSEKATLLKAEKGALKIYADMAYNCPAVEKQPIIRHNDTRYINLMKDHLRKFH